MKFSVTLLGILLLACSAQGQSPADTLTLSEGIRFVWISPGKGPAPKAGQTLLIRYTAGIGQDEVVDQSPEEGYVVKLAEDPLIPAWNELLPIIKKGSTIKAWVKSAKAYGQEGQRSPQNFEQFIIPPNTDMWFEITLLAIR
jgi:FKBP-type peptidyl-prolyl cis-trans isomerase